MTAPDDPASALVALLTDRGLDHRDRGVGQVVVRELALDGDRATIRARTVDAALDLLGLLVAGEVSGTEDSRPTDS